MAKVLVTGATGFLGSYVIERLLTLGIEVIGSSPNVEKAKSMAWFDKVTYKPFDLENQSVIASMQYFSNPDTLIHLAWKGLPNYKANFHLEENLPNQKRFLNALIEQGLNDITVAGTCFEYGMKEGELSEEMEAVPDNPYAIAKLNLYHWLADISKSQSISLKWLRLFYMYGKGQSSKSLYTQLLSAIERNDEFFDMSGGEQIRDFLPVDEVVKAIVNCALQKDVDGIINICSGSGILVKDFVHKILLQENSSIKLNLGVYSYPDYEPMSFWGNNEKLKKVLSSYERSN